MIVHHEFVIMILQEIENVVQIMDKHYQQHQQIFVIKELRHQYLEQDHGLGLVMVLMVEIKIVVQLIKHSKKVVQKQIGVM
jgi:hypothetical protein